MHLHKTAICPQTSFFGSCFARMSNRRLQSLDCRTYLNKAKTLCWVLKAKQLTCKILLLDLCHLSTKSTKLLNIIRITKNCLFSTFCHRRFFFIHRFQVICLQHIHGAVGFNFFFDLRIVLISRRIPIKRMVLNLSIIRNKK